MADETILLLDGINNAAWAPRKERQKKLLGMPFGTASARLRKSLMFMLAGKAGLLGCHQCCKPIESIDEFSIEHKVAWENSDDPVKLYFDLENIAFSHLSCNIRVSKKPNQKYADAVDRKRKSDFRYYERNKTFVQARRKKRRQINSI